MKQPKTCISRLLLLAATALLGACASTGSTTAEIAIPGVNGEQPNVLMTGSRLPAPRSPHMVSQVQAKDYVANLPAQPGTSLMAGGSK
ncbi:MAG: hypothetical protein JNK75_12635 [Betaproteobacteria bacterium]|nr:hypothetical protein [Betaproteobacteria bacterium]